MKNRSPFTNRTVADSVNSDRVTSLSAQQLTKKNCMDVRRRTVTHSPTHVRSMRGAIDTLERTSVPVGEKEVDVYSHTAYMSREKRIKSVGVGECSDGPETPLGSTTRRICSVRTPSCSKFQRTTREYHPARDRRRAPLDLRPSQSICTCQSRRKQGGASPAPP